MKSLSRAGVWGAPIAEISLALATAPAALAVPPNTHPNVGSYSSQTPIDVSFVTDQPVTIRYTLDGSAPTASSPVYSTPLHITRTTTLTWLATHAGGGTNTGAETYTIDTHPPDITIPSPANGASFIQYSVVKAYYYCADAELAYA